MSFTSGGKRNATLSAEDLADINRSLSHIKAGGGRGGGNASGVEEEEKAVVQGDGKVLSATWMMFGSSTNSTEGRPQEGSYYALEDPAPTNSSYTEQPAIHAKIKAGGKGKGAGGSKEDRQQATGAGAGAGAMTGRYPRTAPSSPTAWILLQRGFQLLLADVSTLYHW